MYNNIVTFISNKCGKIKEIISYVSFGKQSVIYIIYLSCQNWKVILLFIIYYFMTPSESEVATLLYSS